jgi:hypothetical protein
MTRDDYDRYVAAFNARDYEGVFDFYVDNPDMTFFGVEIRSRDDLKHFYTFLHSFVKETITVERFASSDEMAAVEAVVRIEAYEDLTGDILEEKGYRLFPIAKGDVQEMLQFIHYHLRDGRIERVRCALG